MGGEPDCNDDPEMGGANDYPGAPEVCDGRDNDCNGAEGRRRGPALRAGVGAVPRLFREFFGNGGRLTERWRALDVP